MICLFLLLQIFSMCMAETRLDAYSTSRLVRNFTVRESGPLKMRLEWKQPIDAKEIEHYVLNVLHISAEGMELQYEAMINTTLSSLDFPVELPQQQLVPLAALVDRCAYEHVMFREIIFLGMCHSLSQECTFQPNKISTDIGLTHNATSAVRRQRTSC